MDQQDELTIELSKPITLGSETYTELVLREPTAGEVDKAQRASRGPDGSGTASDIVLVALVTGIPKPAIERVSYREFRKAADYLGVFWRVAGNWRDVVAEVTKFYGWGPRDAWSLPWSEIVWWHDQAVRMIKAKPNG